MLIQPPAEINVAVAVAVAVAFEVAVAVKVPLSAPCQRCPEREKVRRLFERNEVERV
jgi:hypothetical protein